MWPKTNALLALHKERVWRDVSYEKARPDRRARGVSLYIGGVAWFEAVPDGFRC